MIFAVINDPHLSDTPPVNRTDTYSDDILAKIVEVCHLLREYKGQKKLIILGDLFHRKRPDKTSHRLVQQIMDIFIGCKNDGIDVEIIVGNHDISSGSLDTLIKQPLGDLASVAFLVDYEGSFYDAVPGSVDYMGDKIEENFERIKPKHDILMAHMPIALPGETPIYPHISSRHSHFQDWKYVFYGHIHDSHGMYALGNTTFINHGSISRGSIDEVKVDRQILVPFGSMVEGSLEIRVIPLKNVKPVAEVFKIVEVQRKKTKIENVGTFIDTLKTASVSFISLDSVSKLIDETTDDKEVSNEAKEILEYVW